MRVSFLVGRIYGLPVCCLGVFQMMIMELMEHLPDLIGEALGLPVHGVWWFGIAGRCFGGLGIVVLARPEVYVFCGFVRKVGLESLLMV